jgi:hypothetical protein
MTSGLFALFAFDEKGYPAALSGYVSSHGPISGSYRITGLRPGRYYLLALAGTQDAGYTLTQWYGNIDVPLDSVLRVPMPRVPPGAVTVTVGQGATSGVDFQLGVTTAIAQPSNPAVPQGYRLEQNYPNPFNPSTLIRYQVPAAVRVTLVVFDMLGREVATLENGVHQAGTYTVTFNGSGLASGVYLYRLRAGNFVESKKLLLIR